MIDFAEAIDDCRLIDPGFDGADFTWAKNGLFERLDRILISESWARVFESTMVTNLPRVSSDHGPILVRSKQETAGPRGKAFRFQNMWVHHEGFLELVRNTWNQPIEAGGLLCLQIKMAWLKKALKQWNREVFGNIHTNLKEKEEEISMAQAEFETDPSPENRTTINKLIANYILLLKMEEDFWRQKATLRLVADGDRNTSFYQSWVKQKRVRLRVHSILDNGQEITNEDEIKDSAVSFFHGILAPGLSPLKDPDLDLLQTLPPASFPAELTDPPEEDEVKRAVFNISGDSAPGPDGFTASFYKSCWDIVRSDVVAAVR